MTSTRRGFLAFLGIGSAAVAVPKLPEPKPLTCSCPIETATSDGMLDLGAPAQIVHLSARCEVHGALVKDDQGCGVFMCDFAGCHNPRTRGLAERPKREPIRRGAAFLGVAMPDNLDTPITKMQNVTVRRRLQQARWEREWRRASHPSASLPA